MVQLETLKSHFAFLASSQGFISENDYHTACHGITDEVLLEKLSNWLIEKEYKLVKGVGPQYEKEVKTKVKNPSIEDVKDTKHRTHKNKKKFQESKKTDASFHLNKLIEKMQEFEDEFLPAWKKWKASLEDNKDFLELLASINLTAQDFSNYEQAQRSIMQLIDSYANQIPEDAYIPHTALQAEFLKIDPNATLPINQRITNAISRIFDPNVLAEIFTELWSGIQNGFEKVEPTPESELLYTSPTPVETLPSGVREIEIAPGPSGLETASKKLIKHKKINKSKNITKIATNVARIGYSDKDKLHIKFDNGIKFSSYIAETPLQKAAGLEVFDSLDVTEGLFFPFEEEGSVTFHMGSVKFPIDIIFLMDSPHGLEVGKVVANIAPGSLEWWSYPKTIAVLEIVGGICEKSKIKVGSICSITKRIEAQYAEKAPIEEAAAQFPEEFGLRGFPGEVFAISVRRSYISDDNRIMLYTVRKMPDGTWGAFAKGTPEEIKAEIVPLD